MPKKPKSRKPKKIKKKRKQRLLTPDHAHVLTKRQWRNKKTGRFMPAPRTKKQRAKVRPVKITYRVDEYGRHTGGLMYPRAEKVVKRTKPSTLQEWSGNIGDTLDAMNVTTSIGRRNAVAVDVTVRGWVGKGSSRRQVKINVSLDLSEVRKRHMLRSVLIAHILDAMHEVGVRTQYETKLIKDWAHRETRKRDAERRQELIDATITATVRTE